MRSEVNSEKRIPWNMKRSSSLNIELGTRRTLSQSPAQFHTPIQSEMGDTPSYSSLMNTPEKSLPVDNSKAIVVVDKFNQASVPRLLPGIVAEDASRVVKNAKNENDGTSREEMLRRSLKEDRINIAELGLRISGIIFCLISFSVMAADRTQGWSGDSFYRYKEYRYCFSINIIGFVYSAFRAYDLVNLVAKGNHAFQHHLQHHLTFIADQVLAYLLMSSSSAAATRVDDWQSNWGRDEFTEMANASVAMSFLAFLAFAACSIVSAFRLYSSSLTK